MTLINDPQNAYQLVVADVTSTYVVCHDSRIFEPYNAGTVEIKIGDEVFTGAAARYNLGKDPAHPDGAYYVGWQISPEMRVALDANPDTPPVVWVGRRKPLRERGEGTKLEYLGRVPFYDTYAFRFAALGFDRDWTNSDEDLLIGDKYFWCPAVYVDEENPSPGATYSVLVVPQGPVKYAEDPASDSEVVEFWVPESAPAAPDGPWRSGRFVITNTSGYETHEIVSIGFGLSGPVGGEGNSLMAASLALPGAPSGTFLPLQLVLTRASGEVRTFDTVVDGGDRGAASTFNYAVAPAESVTAQLVGTVPDPGGVPLVASTFGSPVSTLQQRSEPGAPTGVWIVRDQANPLMFSAFGGFSMTSRLPGAAGREVLDPQLLPGFHAARPGDVGRVSEDGATIVYGPLAEEGGGAAAGLLYQSPDNVDPDYPSAGVRLKPGSGQLGQAFSSTTGVNANSMNRDAQHGGIFAAQHFTVTGVVHAETLRLEFANYWDVTDPQLAKAINGLQIALHSRKLGRLLIDTSQMVTESTVVGIEGAPDHNDHRVFADFLIGGCTLEPDDDYTLIISARQSEVWLQLPHAEAGDTVATRLVPGALYARYAGEANDRTSPAAAGDVLLRGSLLFEFGTRLPRAATQIFVGPQGHFVAQSNTPAYSHYAGRVLFPDGGPGGNQLDSASGPEAERRYGQMFNPNLPSVMGDIRRPFVSDVAPRPLEFALNGGTVGDGGAAKAVFLHFRHPEGGLPFNGVRIGEPLLAALQSALTSRGDFALSMEVWDTTFATRDQLNTLYRYQRTSARIQSAGSEYLAWKRASELLTDPTLLLRDAPWMRPGRTYLIGLFAVGMYWYGSPHDHAMAFELFPAEGPSVSTLDAETTPQVGVCWPAFAYNSVLPEYLHFAPGLSAGVELLVGGGKKDVLGVAGGGAGVAVTENEEGYVELEPQVGGGTGGTGGGTGGTNLILNGDGYFGFESASGGGEVVSRAQHEALTARVGALEQAPPVVVTQDQVDEAVTQAQIDAAVTPAKMDAAARRLALPGAVLIEGLPYALPDAQSVNLPTAAPWSLVVGAPALNDGSPLRAMDDTLTLRPPGALLYDSLSLYRFGTAAPKQSANAATITDSLGRVLRQPIGLLRDPAAEELVIRWASAFQQEIAGQVGPSDYVVRLTGDGGATLREWAVNPSMLGGFVETRLTISDLGPLPVSAALEIVPTRLSALRAVANLSGYYDVNVYPQVYAAKSGAVAPVPQATLDGQPAVDEQVISGATYTRQTGLAEYTFRLSNLPNAAPTLTQTPDGLRVQGAGGLTYLNLPTAGRPGTVRKLVLVLRAEPWHPDHPGALVLAWTRSTLEGMLSTQTGGGAQLTRTNGQYRLGSTAIPTGHLRFEVSLTNGFNAYTVSLKAYDADTGVLLATQGGQVSSPEYSPAASLRFLLTPAYALVNGGAARLDLPAETYTVERWTEWSE